MSEHIIELVIRCDTAEEADDVLAEIRTAILLHTGFAQLDAAAIIPASRYDAEPDVEGVPA